MRPKKVLEADELKYLIHTRVGKQKYEELQKLLAQNRYNDMSSLLRDFLHNRPIKVFTRDLTLDNLMEELARIRTEIKAIGVNINQITKRFNTYPEPQRKAFYAKMAFEEYRAVQPKIDRLLDIVSKLSKKWLQE